MSKYITSITMIVLAATAFALYQWPGFLNPKPAMQISKEIVACRVFPTGKERDDCRDSAVEKAGRWRVSR